MIRATQLSYVAAAKWDIYDATYDIGTQDFSAIGQGADGWTIRPLYRLLQLMTLTTSPVGGSIVDVVPAAGADLRKLLTAYIAPSGDISILGLDTDGARLQRAGIQSPTALAVFRPTRFRLLVWNADGSGTNIEIGFVDTDPDGRSSSRSRSTGVRAHDCAARRSPVVRQPVPGSTDPSPEAITRSALLRRTVAAAAGLAFGGATERYAFAGPLRYAHRELNGSLSIAQWRHFMPEYDVWLTKWAKTWGESNDVQVDIDHLYTTRLPPLAAAEVKAQQGHDIFGFQAPPTAYEDQVIDHAAIVREVERAVGPYGDVGMRSTYNPKTKKYFGVSDYYVPAPLIWRHDLWNAIGESPASWDHVRLAAPKLKAAGIRSGSGSRTIRVEPLSDRVPDVLRLLHPGRVERPDDRQQEHRPGRAVHGRPLQAWRGAPGLLLGRGVEQPVRLLGQGIDDPQRDLGRPPRRGSGPARLRTIFGCGRSRGRRPGSGSYNRPASTRSGSSRETGTRPKSSSPTSASTTGTRRSPRSCSTSELPGCLPRSADLQDRCRRHAPTPRQVHDPHHDRLEIHPQRRLPRYSNAAVDETLSRFLIPRMFASVSQGRMTAARLGAGYREGDAADLGEVEGRREALAPRGASARPLPGRLKIRRARSAPTGSTAATPRTTERGVQRRRRSRTVSAPARTALRCTAFPEECAPLSQCPEEEKAPR